MYALLLAGGGGTRLWPISTKETPKQFVVIDGEKYSLFQNTLLRCLRFTDCEHIIILTGEIYKEQIIKQASEIGINLPEENILCEPKPKGTLPAVMYGVTRIGQGKTAAVFPCDHSIGKVDEFLDAISKAKTLPQKLVTFGIKPDRPETGYGYIKPSENEGCGFKVAKFCEKPNLETALSYLEQGYLWNSGMFVFNTTVFLEEVKKHCPDVYAAFLSPESAFDSTPSVSIDIGVMEKSDIVSVIPVDLNWSDLGGFRSVYEYRKELCDEDGNIIIGDSAQIDCENCLLYSTGEKIRVMGLSDVVVVSHNGQILVSKVSDLHRIKEIIDK